MNRNRLNQTSPLKESAVAHAAIAAMSTTAEMRLLAKVQQSPIAIDLFLSGLSRLSTVQGMATESRIGPKTE